MANLLEELHEQGKGTIRRNKEKEFTGGGSGVADGQQRSRSNAGASLVPANECGESDDDEAKPILLQHQGT